MTLGGPTTGQSSAGLQVLVMSAILLALLAVGCLSHSAKSTDAVSVDFTRLQLRLDGSSSPGEISLVSIGSVRSLPTSVRLRIPRMSNPGGLFNASDVSLFSFIPNRRLIFGGISDRYCLVHYEYGGIGHGYMTALFAMSGDQSMPLWAHAGGRYPDLKEFAKEKNPRKLTNEVNDIIF